VNYIQRLTEERDDARKALRSARADLLDIMLHLSSSKFAWPDNDYVHVRTDILPEIEAVRFAMLEEAQR
jgi:hypothetical protein